MKMAARLAIVVAVLWAAACGDPDSSSSGTPRSSIAPDAAWTRVRESAWNNVRWELFTRSSPDGSECQALVVRPRPDGFDPPGSVRSAPDFAYEGCGAIPVRRFPGQPLVLLLEDQRPEVDYHVVGASVARDLRGPLVASYSDGSTEEVEPFGGGQVILFFPPHKRLTAIGTTDGSTRCALGDAGLGVATMFCS